MMIRKMPDEELEGARQLLREYLEYRDKRAGGQKMTDEEFQEYLDNAPEEDEEITEEEWRGIEEGRKAIQEGRVVPFDQVAKELGI